MRLKALVASGILLAAATTQSAADEPWNIRIGWVTTPTHLQPLIDALHERHPELFHHFGQSYVAEGFHFQGTTPQIQALALNDLEIAAFGPEALALAVNNAHLDVRMIADVFQDGVPGHGSVTFVVKDDSPFQKPEDLRGHTIASNTIGSFSDSALRVMMRRHGLGDRDFITVEAPFPTMPAMLDEGKVDMINLLPQYHYMLAQKHYRILFTGADGEGRIQAVLWAMRADVIAAHRAALVDFLEDHVRATQWMLDPAHRPEAVAIAASVTKAKPETLAYVFGTDDQFHAPDGRPDVAATQNALDVELKFGLIKKGLTVAPNYVDLGPIDEANHHLGGS